MTPLDLIIGTFVALVELPVGVLQFGYLGIGQLLKHVRCVVPKSPLPSIVFRLGNHALVKCKLLFATHVKLLLHLHLVICVEEACGLAQGCGGQVGSV